MEAKKKKKASGPSRNRREREEKAGTTLVTSTMLLLHEAQAGAIAKEDGISRSAAIAKAIAYYYAARFGETPPWLLLAEPDSSPTAEEKRVEAKRRIDDARDRALANPQNQAVLADLAKR